MLEYVVWRDCALTSPVTEGWGLVGWELEVTITAVWSVMGLDERL